MPPIQAAPPVSLPVQRVKDFLDALIPPPRPFAISLWDGTILPAVSDSSAGRPDFTVRLNSAGALRRMFQVPFELSMGEAYFRGDFDIEGDNFALARGMHTLADLGIFKSVGYVRPGAEKTIRASRLLRLLKLARLRLTLPSDTPPGRPLYELAFRGEGRIHSKERDRAAIKYHYDFGNDFYKLWLGKWMQYSSNYYPTGTEDLNAAQDAKLEHICRKLRLKEGDMLLDIGCGWGGLVTYAAQRYGVCAVGITLSEDQYGLAKQRIAQAGLQDRVSIQFQDYRDLSSQSFDKIACIEMSEHVGIKNLPTFFRQVYRLLRPGGLFLNQMTCPSVAHFAPRNRWTKFVERVIVGRSSFTSHYLLPDAASLPISHTNLIAQQAGFEVMDVENIRQHYLLTLKSWIGSLEAHAQQVIELVGRERYRIYQLYLYSFLVGFEAGALDNDQSLFARPGPVMLPLSRADLYS